MAQAEQKRGLFAQKNKGKRFTFEGKNTNTDQLVRGKVVTKNEEKIRLMKMSPKGFKIVAFSLRMTPITLPTAIPDNKRIGKE